MGEAKRRGTFEQRKAEAIKRELNNPTRTVQQEILHRRPSPEHIALTAVLASMGNRYVRLR